MIATPSQNFLGKKIAVICEEFRFAKNTFRCMRLRRNVSTFIEYAHTDTKRTHYDVMQQQQKQQKSSPAKNFDRVEFNQLRKKAARR